MSSKVWQVTDRDERSTLKSLPEKRSWKSLCSRYRLTGEHEPTGRLAATHWDKKTQNNKRSRPGRYGSKVAAHRAKLMANRGSWTSSVSRCCAMMACIFMRLFSVAFCSVTVSVGDSSWRQRRDCTDSRNSVYTLFLSASAFPQLKFVFEKQKKNPNKPKSKTNLSFKKETLTPRGSLGRLRLLAVQVL